MEGHFKTFYPTWTFRLYPTFHRTESPQGCFEVGLESLYLRFQKCFKFSQERPQLSPSTEICSLWTLEIHFINALKTLKNCLRKYESQ